MINKSYYRHIVNTLTTLYDFGVADKAQAEIINTGEGYTFKVQSVNTGLMLFIEHLTTPTAIKLFLLCYSYNIRIKADNQLFFSYINNDYKLSNKLLTL